MKNQSSVSGSTTRNSSLSEFGLDERSHADDHRGNAKHPAHPNPPTDLRDKPPRPALRPMLEQQYRDIVKNYGSASLRALYSGMGEDVRLAIEQRTRMLESAMLLSDRDPENAAKSFDTAADVTRVASGGPGRWAGERRLLSGETQAMLTLAATMRAKGTIDPRHQRKLITDATNRAKMLSATVRHQPTPIISLAINVAQALEDHSRGGTQTATLSEVFARRDVSPPVDAMTSNEKVEKYLEGLVLPIRTEANARPSTSSAASRAPEARSPRTARGPISFAK